MREGRTGDPRSTGRRLTVNQAADVLGVTPEARRVRIRRRTIAVEREAGRVYVLLAGPAHSDKPHGESELVAVLREQLAAERQAHAEARRIIAGLVERIPPQLEAREPPHEPVEEGADRVEDQSATGEPQESVQRP